MSEVKYVVLGTRHVPDTRNTEVRVSAPDLEEITVTVPDSLVGSAMADEVIRRAIAVRQESSDILRPVDE